MTVSRETFSRLQRLADEHRLPPSAPQQLEVLLELLAAEPTSITTVRDPAAAVDVHVEDSLTGLRVADLAAAGTIADLGSGGGFPGLVLAVALPGARVSLVESVGKKTAFLSRAVEAAGLANVEVVTSRAEGWKDGLGRQGAVTARALASLPVLAEYAAPILVDGGVLVAWKGRRDATEEAAGAVAAEHLGLRVEDVVVLEPRAGADARHLHVLRKVAPTPPTFPRREGMARKRPLGMPRDR